MLLRIQGQLAFTSTPKSPEQMGGDSFSTTTFNAENEEVVNVDVLIDRLFIRFCKLHGRLASEDRDECIDYVKSHVDLVLNRNVARDVISARLRKVIEYKKQMQHLLSLPKLEQRTPDWYAARNTLITASDFAQALGKGKFGTQKQFLVKKTGYEEDVFNEAMPALQWGILFEQVACDAYSLKNDNVNVHEFGLLKHPYVSHLGASPDGISDVGVMVEIKCPWRRKITPGEIPMQYYYQMQGQLDVCGLDECDYLECKITVYGDRQEFVDDFHCNPDYKGIIIQASYIDPANPGSEQPSVKRTFYVDKTIWNDLHAQLTWLDYVQRSKECVNAVQIKITYWRIETLSIQRVYRDPEFIASIYPQLDTVWKQVVAFKTDKSAYDAYIEMNANRTNQKQSTNKPSKEFITIDTAASGNNNVGSGRKFGKENNKFAGYAFVEDDEAR